MSHNQQQEFINAAIELKVLSPSDAKAFSRLYEDYLHSSPPYEHGIDHFLRQHCDVSADNTSKIVAAMQQGIGPATRRTKSRARGALAALNMRVSRWGSAHKHQIDSYLTIATFIAFISNIVLVSHNSMWRVSTLSTTVLWTTLALSLLSRGAYAMVPLTVAVLGHLYGEYPNASLYSLASLVVFLLQDMFRRSTSTSATLRLRRLLVLSVVFLCASYSYSMVTQLQSIASRYSLASLVETERIANRAQMAIVALFCAACVAVFTAYIRLLTSGMLLRRSDKLGNLAVKCSDTAILLRYANAKNASHMLQERNAMAIEILHLAAVIYMLHDSWRSMVADTLRGLIRKKQVIAWLMTQIDPSDGFAVSHAVAPGISPKAAKVIADLQQAYVACAYDEAMAKSLIKQCSNDGIVDITMMHANNRIARAVSLTSLAAHEGRCKFVDNVKLNEYYDSHFQELVAASTSDKSVISDLDCISAMYYPGTLLIDGLPTKTVLVFTSNQPESIDQAERDLVSMCLSGLAAVHRIYSELKGSAK